MAVLGHYILAVNCSPAYKLVITKQNASYSTLKFHSLKKKKRLLAECWDYYGSLKRLVLL